MKESIEYRMGQNDVIDSDLTFFVTVKMLLKDRIDYKKIIEYVEKVESARVKLKLENNSDIGDILQDMESQSTDEED